MSMRSIIVRVCVSLLLLGNVASLSTHLVQNDSMFMDEGSGYHEMHASSVESKISKTEIPLLAKLRGRDHIEQHLDDTSSARLNSKKVFAAAYLDTLARMSLTRVLAVAFLIVITAISCYIVCGPEEESSETTPEQMSPAKPRSELLAMQGCEGTWARTYRESDEQGKQALELLFRCHIIPTVEFAHSIVGQEHVGECVWIATHMLRDRPLDEWLGVWPEAQRTFEQSVTSCYAARMDVRSNWHDSVQGTGLSQDSQSPRALQFLDSQATDRSSQPFPPTRGQVEPRTISPNYILQGESSGGQSSAPPQKPGSDPKPASLPAVLKTPSDRNQLLDRCRQLMAKSDSQKTPWEAKAKSAPPAAFAQPSATGNAQSSVQPALSQSTKMTSGGKSLDS